MGWARTGGERGVYRILVGNPGKGDYGGDVDEWIISVWNSRKWDVGIWTG